MNWDIHTKLLLKECPQDFVRYFTPNAHYVGLRDSNFQTRIDSRYKRREMRGDLTIEAEEQGEAFLIAPEFQSQMNEKMDERLLGYSYEATREHNLNVLSAVFYLRPVSNPPEPPLHRPIPNGYLSLAFNYYHIELHKMRVAELQALNLDGFWPWMVLCEDGGNCETVDMVFYYLYNKQRGKLILLAKFYADMTLKKKAEKLWLQRRFDTMNEFLFENTSVYRGILASGKKLGRQEARQQFERERQRNAKRLERERQEIEQQIERERQEIEQQIERERQENLEHNRNLIASAVQAHFPNLLPLLKEKTAQTHSLEQYQQLSLMLISARTEDEAKNALLSF